MFPHINLWSYLRKIYEDPKVQRSADRRKPTTKIHFPPLPSITLPSQEVLVAASVTAVTAVAAATVTQPVINALKIKIQKFYKPRLTNGNKTARKKGILRKIKENVDDHDEQMQMRAMVRLGVVIWSGFIITLNYVSYLWSKDWSIIGHHVRCFNFTGALATFGLSTGNKKSKKTNQNNEETNSSLSPVSPAVARANTVTPQFTTGSMNSTTTTTQTIVETEQCKSTVQP
ncbi:MAG: hypothetical protein CM15mV102_290 [uncultured marine virus]|nr:MAG: hypothetical protein CM15mV102_290 [uncultured marine virus]